MCEEVYSVIKQKRYQKSRKSTILVLLDRFYYICLFLSHYHRQQSANIIINRFLCKYTFKIGIYDFFNMYFINVF